MENGKLDKKMNILAVDNFATMRKVVRNILHQLGFENVSEAENGEDGYRMRSRALSILSYQTGTCR